MRIAIEQQSQVHRKVCTFPRILRAYEFPSFHNSRNTGVRDQRLVRLIHQLREKRPIGSFIYMKPPRNAHSQTA